MKYQLEVSDVKIADLNNFCIIHNLELDVNTMTINLAEVYLDGR
jgi:hypothetical protein